MEEPVQTEKTDSQNYAIRVPVASNYDLDSDYDYIMSRALKSYKHHREKEKAETRRGPLKSAYVRRHHLRPKTAPPARFVQSMKVNNIDSGARPASVLMPQVDAIKAVSKANPVPDDSDRSPRRVLQVAKVSLNMMQEQNHKTASYLKRNNPSHPWHSHSYPSVKPMEKFVRIPHAYMSASVGEREMSSALSSRSSSAKSSPSHSVCRPKSAATKNSKYDYDGGLFTHPKSAHPEYFIIHPDWVSESMSIQKLSLTDRTKTLIPKSKSFTLPGRRCNSAPPSKYRNPITWESIQTT
ncbi:uncharacterized protein LOC132742966 isoform X3 [Ruditapes philippinarum]|uniref:uncharacterized protein LOC132742966 isoform X3 n=1 Tax=Ruditapes philippinarum TaxID=129788 RepID=UPI00295A78A6|nr:uncharacterized protein LOC132742966 isoform X3 [Ruditapes philippinarum]